MGEREPGADSVQPGELLPEIREVTENVEYGYPAVESNIGIVLVCHASDRELTGFAGKPVISKWELVKMLSIHFFAPILPSSIDLKTHSDLSHS